ncbi:4-hydroxy-tetrahydrodipicolinate reductase [Flavobacteriaceae bacterium]|jgi:4-hydroxy-tetrahydrodipicolinate reductase|nr:4-hydroxy-tetrahydrodipicolinate reductase [bacterium]MDB9913164.1 4-hydroxy-tetrahydrodipicolinate reductase [Flavobacteriaceae bacterium]MDB9993973.1 4-hydroxy-tetrahydrodipicolinate reductase [Flavobacteriaceae bacterium]|tara:strand:+ start:723 stop:1424 length:702 start_codon:yes stop_codon:yes gene_type:complete
MKIALLGYGKMGKIVEKLAIKKGHTIVSRINQYSSKEEILKADIAIEFSTPQAAVSNIKFCLENDIPIVSGTTGWLVHYDKMIKLCENRNGSFIYASNFSIGVNLFFYINEYVSNLIEPWKDYQVSIEEVHHNQKLDIPSGTAVTLAEGIIRNSDKKNWELNGTDAENINITAKRINDIKGTHIINYNSNIDTISIKHEAHSRDGFALGAILAAEWLADKKGIFTMKDVLQIK